MEYNRFGAIYTDVEGVIVGPTATDMGGQTQIEAAMDRVEEEIVTACPERLFKLLREVEHEVLTDYAAGGETSFNAHVSPVVDDTSKVFVFKNWGQCPTVPGREWALSSGYAFTVHSSTGVLTLTLNDTLTEGERLLVSYELDRTHSGYTFSLLKDLLVKGTAAKRVIHIYTENDAPFGAALLALEEYKEGLQRLRDGLDIPAELRELKLCRELEKQTTSKVQTVELFRG